MARTRASKIGRNIRRGRRVSQVKKRVSTLNVGANDAENLIELLTKNVQTLAGLKRSKRLEKLIFSNKQTDLKKLFRFKDFSLAPGSIKPKKIKLGNVLKRLMDGFWRDSESQFMKENRELVNDYNELSEEEKLNADNAIVSKMKTKYRKHLTDIGVEIVEAL